MWHFIQQLFLLIIILTTSNGSKIILMPFAWKSHVSQMSAIGETLVSKGHDVSIMLPPSFPDTEKIKANSQFQVLEYRIAERDMYGMPHGDMIESLIRLTPIEDFRINIDGFKQFCSNALSDEDFLQRLQTEHFDLAIVDAFPGGRCNLVLPYRLGIPYISLTTTYEPWLLRVPALPSFVPFPMAQFFTDRMTFTERLSNLYTMVDWSVSTRILYLSDDFIKPFFTDKPFVSLDELARKSKLWLFNTDIILDFPRPTMPNVINIGGLLTKPSKPLPEDLLRFVDDSENGFIVMSFGSFDVLTEAKLMTFIDGFSHIPQRVILRTTIDPNMLKVEVPNNIKLMPWIPQNDLFGHPKCRLFITHCGANGQFEALYNGIPMLGFPIFGDQPYNARRAEHHGFGLHMDILNVDSAHLVSKVKELITNHSYQDNIRKASKIFRSRAMNPRERAAFWVQQVLENNVDHLRSSALDMVWYEYLMLDMLLVIVVVLTLIISLCCGLICYCFNKKDSHKVTKLD